ncbi:DctP family TRAP transporter solute-binding subunit [Aurantimonas sp. C2-6-R+9]|uniref:DctP family TRAP transporter solute-binding subunit n=1 Tax=unclassified Aurantimonas TaxID=2638230 RepID=UPI002E195903|nr:MULTISPECIES: DctP family TRAP transporter solute-binding subunit [unclassified Aurantimonas]MEC5291261.1 DctP family TRAP transporter solute-binding subunit [Aurantimonas sp. C2-3-R2]MEC5381612.1 DctP family TRAP transporter solute-binding subunit [Aurantimonas sp. C2-6-R+9]MEC5412367.1 DctP family TRAP transporter solute-binding subunit [Aurantimonas sp. C2-4-R8]
MKNLLLGTISAAALIAGASSASAAAGCDDGEMVIKFAHVVAATGHPKGDAATLLAERVNQEMDGKACMEVFPNSTLFDDDKVLEALLLGDVQLAAPSLSKFEAYTLKYRLYDLPFLFSNLKTVEAFNDGETGKNLLTVMEDKGYTGLGYWLSGLKQFSANKPLLVPSDASGLKFRIQTSDVAEAMIEAMGGSAQKLAFKEVYGALQTGVVDGQENTWSNIYTQKFFEVQDGITETNHQVLAYLLVTSTEWLDGLEPEFRDQFMKIVDEVTAEANGNVAETEAKNRQNIIDAGGEVRELSAEQREEWVSTMKPVWDKFTDDIGQDVIDAAVATGSTN